MGKEKFSSKIDSEVLKELREFSRSSRRNISDILSEAVAEHLGRVRVRPVFRESVDQVLTEHEELLRRLAQ